MRLRAFHFLLFLGLFLPGLAHADIPARMSDAEKRTLRDQRDLRRETISIRDPRVLSAQVESAKVTANVLGGAHQLRAWVTLDVTIPKPLEPREIEELALSIRKAANRFDSVGIRFVLAGPVEDRDPEAGKPFYAWHLFTDDKADAVTFMGVSLESVKTQAGSLKLAANESLLGVWVDHNYLNGAVALISKKIGCDLVFLFDPERRWALPSLPKAGGKIVRATTSTGPLGTYKADGKGTDSLGARLTENDQLLIYGGRYELASKPWLFAKRWKPYKE